MSETATPLKFRQYYRRPTNFRSLWQSAPSLCPSSVKATNASASLGKRRWETIGPNQHEAKKVLAQRMWERRQGKFHVTRPFVTMAEFAGKWQEDYLTVQVQLGRLKESTIVGYRNNLTLHILPFFATT